MITLKRWAHAGISLVALGTLSAACGADKKQTSDSKSVVLAGAIVSHEPELRARWNAMKEITTRGGEFVSSGERMNTFGRELGARMPYRNNESTLLRTGTDRFSLSLKDALPSNGALASGKLVYRDALTNRVDRIVTATDYILEESLLLADKSAGSSFTWTLDNDSHSAVARSDGEGGLYISQAGKEASLHVSRPFAVDAGGNKHDAELTWNSSDHSLRVTIPDSDTLAYPVVLDPTFEVVLWYKPIALPEMSVSSMVFDSWRGEVFLPAQDTNFFFNGAWRAQVANTPMGRLKYSLAFDEEHGEVLLFGGDAVGATQDTWTWNGESWKLRHPAHQPEARWGAATTYDPIRKKIFIFGGTDRTNVFGDTWSWDGNDWTKLSPATSPPVRSGASMAFDTNKGVSVLYGGQLDNSTLRSDTWSFDGTTWTNMNAPLAGRFNSSMAYDPVHNNVVLYGGNDVTNILGETWVLSGNTWSQIVPITNPSPHQGAPIAFDRTSKRVVMHGGVKTAEGLIQTADLDTWTWDGSNWTKIPSSSPFPRANHSIAYDKISKRTLVYGGTADNNAAANLKNETWSVTKTLFTKLSPASSPSATTTPGLAFDDERNELILFGGANASGTVLNETWGWKGSTWTKKTPAHSPPPYAAVQMAYDAARKQIVIFGASPAIGGVPTDATWIWNGTDWTEASPAHRPSARFANSLTYDAARAKIVCFGGTDNVSATKAKDDTWTWDGTDWTLEAPAAKPSGRALHSSTYDSTRGLVLVWGGVSQRDTWAWDGVTWTQLSAFGPPSRWFPGFSYNPDLRESVLVGGSILGLITFSDTWWLRLSGGGCTDDNQCDTGHCVDGVCCNVESCGTCQACNVKDHEGVCSLVKSAQDLDTCAQIKACDPNGICKKNNGEACTVGADCASTFCVDGVCCSTECKGFCQACKGDMKQSGASGTCGVAKEGLDPHNDCPDDEARSCERDGTCDGSGRCRYYAKGTSCGPSVCTSNRAVGRVCDGVGACNDSTDGVDCSPYVCDLSKGACTNSCTRDTDCTELARCDVKSGKCVTKEGSSCDGDHTIISPAGPPTDCGTYRCEGSTCKTSCATIADCVSPAVCNTDGQCVLDGTSAEGGDGEGGCSCESVGQKRAPSHGALSLFALAAIGGAAIRRRRAT